MYYVYSLWCEDSSLYTGMTDDIRKRVHAHYHRLKSCAKYTKSHRVTGLAGLWICESETAARKLEFRIKRLKREKKLALFEEPAKLFEFFPELSEYSFSFDGKTKFEELI